MSSQNWFGSTAPRLQVKLPKKISSVTSSVELISGFVSQDSTRVIVDPVFNSLEFLGGHFSNVGSLGHKAPQDSVAVLIAASLPTAVRVSIISLLDLTLAETEPRSCTVPFHLVVPISSLLWYSVLDPSFVTSVTLLSRNFIVTDL